MGEKIRGYVTQGNGGLVNIEESRWTLKPYEGEFDELMSTRDDLIDCLEELGIEWWLYRKR